MCSARMRRVYGAVGDGGLGVLYNYLHQSIRANHHKDGAKTAAKTGSELLNMQATWECFLSSLCVVFKCSKTLVLVAM